VSTGFHHAAVQCPSCGAPVHGKACCEYCGQSVSYFQNEPSARPMVLGRDDLVNRHRAIASEIERLELLAQPEMESPSLRFPRTTQVMLSIAILLSLIGFVWQVAVLILLGLLGLAAVPIVVLYRWSNAANAAQKSALIRSDVGIHHDLSHLKRELQEVAERIARMDNKGHEF